jgi:hypothetical protein
MLSNYLYDKINSISKEYFSGINESFLELLSL